MKSGKSSKERKMFLKITTAIIGLIVAALGVNYTINQIKGSTIITDNSQTTVNDIDNNITNHTEITDKMIVEDKADPSEDEEKLPNSEYEHSYINNENSLIHEKENTELEGVLTTYCFPMETVSFETVFGDERATISFGNDTPVGHKLSVIFDEIIINLQIESELMNDFMEGGDLIGGLIVQISPYDFDKDGENELIVCIGDGFIQGLCAVFSYTFVDNKFEKDPFTLEICRSIQEEVLLFDDELCIPIGSQGYIESYKYMDKDFYSRVPRDEIY